MSPYTDEAFCLKDKVESCASVDSPALVPPPLLFCGEDMYYDSELCVNRK